jgi:glucose-1-phosphate adenylyltransferase
MELATTLSARTRTFILAGGQGERLLPLTLNRPKPAVPFGGIFRIIDFTLSNCVNSGLKEIRLLTQYKYEPLHGYVRQNWRDRAGNHPICVPPTSGKRYRGTADAVFQNLAIEEDLPDFVLILSGDHIYEMDYRDMLIQHAATGADLTIGTVEHPVQDASRYGVIQVDSDFRVVGFEEKPKRPRPVPSDSSMALASMGIYVFSKDCLLRAFSDNVHDFGKDLIPRLIGHAKVHAYDFRDPIEDTPRYWRDIGTIEAYYESNMDLVSKNPLFDPFHKQERLPGRMGVKNSVISPNVQIGENVQIEGSVLMPGVSVGNGARIRKAIIEEDIHIPAGTEIGFNSAKDRGSHFVTETGIVVVNEGSRMSGMLQSVQSA